MYRFLGENVQEACLPLENQVAVIKGNYGKQSTLSISFCFLTLLNIDTF